MSASNDNLRSSSFSTLQDAWESRRAFQKTTDTNTICGNNSNSQRNYILSGDSNRLHPQATGVGHHHINSISDVEHTDIISRRRERRRLKREIYNQRHQSDKSDSETETEDSHFARHALERLERRRSNSNPRRTPSRNLRSQQDLITDNNSDSNDENNNECPSDKTLDSGVFDLALSNLSANISKLSKRYNSDEFLAGDCLSPKSGYSSATESLAESLAESTTTFYESPDDHDNMDRRKHGITGNKAKPGGGSFKHQKGDKPSVKTAVLNSTRANLMNGHVMQTKTQNNSSSSSSVNKRELTSMSSSVEDKPTSKLSADPKQTLQTNSTIDHHLQQTKPQKAKTINKKHSVTPVDKTSSKSSDNTSNSSVAPTETSTSNTSTVGEKQKLEKKPSDGKQQPPQTKQKPNKNNKDKENNKPTLAKVDSGAGVVAEDSVSKKKSPATPTSSRPSTPSSATKKAKLNKTDSNSSVNSVGTPATKAKLNKTDSNCSVNSVGTPTTKAKLNTKDSNSSVTSTEKNENSKTTPVKEKKQPPPVQPKTKRNSIVVDNNKPENCHP